ncbi:MAG: HAD-IC family P-type ATPase [Patescibacteria group bacterium]|nr:HAD-IC family P-type ATPase [Patescibacteria group bacterium]
MITKIENNWYSLKKKDLEKKLETNFKEGLSESAVVDLQKKYGKNILTQDKQITFLNKIWIHLKSPMAFVLIIAGVAALILGHFLDAMVVFLVVIINLVVGIFQENKADQAFEKLNTAQKKYATVLRAGKQKIISVSELVKGDVVLLVAGSSVPADLRLIENENLLVNESTLTGEWVGVSKTVKAIEKTDSALLSKTNLVWMGTLISAGYGKGIVVGIGQDTQLGKISEDMSNFEMSTPLKRKLNKLVRFLFVAVLISSALIFTIGVYNGETYANMLLVSIAVAISAIPQGLPIAMTSVLSVGMKEILKKGGLVKNLLAPETMGNVSVILTDKTGTITQAKMKLSQIITANKSEEEKKEVLKSAVLTSDAFIERDDKSELIINGRPLEKAIVSAGLEQGISQDELKEDNKRLDLLLFSSENGYSASLNEYKKGKQRIYISGRPEILLEKSKFVFKDGKKQRMNPEDIKYFKRLLEEKTTQGMRLTAVAFKTVSWKKIEGKVLEELTFGGLLAFDDPIREDVYESIKVSKELGVRTIMLTGDNRGTAQKIAEEAGIIKKGGRVLEGKDLENMSDKELTVILKDVNVFARMSPSQKLRISKILKGKGEITAMTGDGINDAPALRNANVGIAVEGGTEVAKESADMILLNNSFSVIVYAIEEGRRVVSNLKKIVAYLLSTSFSEVLIIGGALIFGLPLPLLASQILWINIVEEGLMNFSFVFEPKEKNKKRQDRFVAEKEILSSKLKQMIMFIGLTTGVVITLLYFILIKLNLPLEEIRTIIFVALSVDSLFFAFSLKSFDKPIWRINILGNKFLIIAWLSGMIMVIASFTVPFLRTILHTTPLNMFDFLILVGLGIFDVFIIEIAKYFFFEKKKKKTVSKRLPSFLTAR